MPERPGSRVNYEYLLFNLTVVVGPFVLSFLPPVYYVRMWPKVFTALLLPLVYYVTWDILVTGRHWWFNHQYTLEMRLANLPVGEWLFFVTVPFSCLLIWESLGHYYGEKKLVQLQPVYRWLPLAIPAGILLFWFGKEYTGLVFLTAGLLPFLERLLKTSVLIKAKTYLFLAIVAALILVFNGYLTARPVVLYGVAYQLDWRVFTIPIEDFGFGFTHLLMCAMFYDRSKGYVYVS